MKRTKGFTLVELLVVVAIIALLVSILLPTLGRAKELAKQALCGANLNGVGKGILLYQSENDDCPPWVESSEWNTRTGTNATDVAQPSTLSPTALMFLVVRSGQPADIFRCPSDDNAIKMSSTKNSSGDYYWDFCDDSSTNARDHCKRISYSIQAPLYDSAGTTYSSGISDDGGLAVMADKTPHFDRLTPCTDWTADPVVDQSDGMSQNHGSGDFINVLFADYHVKGGKRADVGIAKDNIYSASGDDDTQQGAGTNSLTSHKSVDDSYLIGPLFITDL
ncbi:MAG: type II secretion system protein [Phycisphaerae bacterium]|nr:type II secretion system protein [Phycisphaerae bacterium]